MGNKNLIDEKFDKISNVVKTSKTVYKALNIIWYISIIVAVCFMFWSINYYLSDGNTDNIAATFISIFFIVVLVF